MKTLYNYATIFNEPAKIRIVNKHFSTPPLSVLDVSFGTLGLIVSGTSAYYLNLYQSPFIVAYILALTIGLPWVMRKVKPNGQKLGSFLVSFYKFTFQRNKNFVHDDQVQYEFTSYNIDPYIHL